MGSAPLRKSNYGIYSSFRLAAREISTDSGCFSESRNPHYGHLQQAEFDGSTPCHMEKLVPLLPGSLKEERMLTIFRRLRGTVEI